ncbi:hypothetical protein V501_07883 [Pseudogymnoascus sp. VKM F-4519 (FW-2642)]|nr:hypothetical protein V501_07883 [Pseudogymnoascus sp. VKM F-4519 (FW-2642)]
MSQLTPQRRCSACEATSAQWAIANTPTHSNLDLSSPGKPYPIPPTFGTDSHPYARQIGETQFMVTPASEPEPQQKKGWVKPEYDVVVKKEVDMEYVRELIANILPPGSAPEEGAIPPPMPNVPGRPPRKCLSGLEMVDAIPPPRPNLPTSPYERLAGFNPEDVLPNPRPNIPLPPDAPPNQGLSGLNPEDALPTPRPSIPLPPDAPPNR